MSRTKPPLKWHGGKYYLAKKIIALMPKHLHYVEPYFGGGQVLFQKDPQGVSEVVNDIDGELMNFWDVLRSPTSARELIHVLNNVPFSEDLWKMAEGDSLAFHGIATCIEDAAKFFIKYRQSRQGLGKDFATLSRNRTRSGMNEQVSAWLGAVEGLPEAHERLRRVVVLNSDALDVIRQQDGPNTLFYLDPPYLHETRTATNAYEFEMSKEDHTELLGTLMTLRGDFILSGYWSDLYDSVAALQNWRRIDIEIDNKASSKKVKEVKTECLWTNF